MTLEELRELALEYDAECGEYPEHIYEGFAFIEWLELRLTGKNEEGNWRERRNKWAAKVEAKEK